MLKSMLFSSGINIKGGSWVATLGGSSNDYGYSISVASDNSVYVCGNANSTGAVGNDLLIAKFNSSGSLQWQKTLSGSMHDKGNFITVASDGSVYVCGITDSYSEDPYEPYYDLLITKFNSSGSLQWQKILGGSDDDYGQSVAVASDGSVYVYGYTYSAGMGYSDSLITKFNSSGALQWQKTFGVNTNDLGQSVAVASDGSVYICGYTNSSNPGLNRYDLLIAKFNSSGTLSWQKTLSGSDDVCGYSVAVASDNSVYVSGYTNSTGAVGNDLLIAKFNSSGSLQWQKILGGNNDDRGQSVTVASDGSVYVCGYTYSAGVGGGDLLIAKFNSSGTLQWQKTLGGSEDDRGQSVAAAPDGSIYVCGYTYSVGTGSSDLLIARITDGDVEEGTIEFGPFTLQQSSLTSKTPSLTSETSSLTLKTSSLANKTSSLTLKTSNLTASLYKGTE